MSDAAELRTALVLAGGGARGAYEAGALSVLLPELERRGERPSIYAGTSVGALNAAGLAANAHLPARDQADALLAVWRSVRKGEVIRPILRRTAPLAMLRYAGQVARLPGVRLPSLLDPAPLWENLPRWIDFDAIHRNCRDGPVEAVAVATTSARTGRTVVFCEGRADLPLHRSHAVAYVRAELEVEHVGASAAIPLLWPPVRVERPERARGWYVDGGTRLNTPIKPALDLGADRLVVIAVDSIRGPVMESEDPELEGDREADEPPDLGDGALHLLEGALVDPLIADMRTLGAVNAFFVDDKATGVRLYRTARSKPPYKRVPYVFIGPDERGAVGDAAASIWRRRFGGVKGLRDPDLVFLNELVGGMSTNHGELLSLLLFDPSFIDLLIEMGGSDVRRWLAQDHDADGPWQLGPLDVFTRPREWTAG